MEQRTPGSLLVLVDHHRAMLTAAPKLLAAIRRRVIIDHHRRAEDVIEEVMLQYMEPSTSSTSEMVTGNPAVFPGTHGNQPAGGLRPLCWDRC